MHRIGIDVGSTFAKYCIIEEADEYTNNINSIIHLFSEPTPVHQKKYFQSKVDELREKYRTDKIVSCGYGKHNVIGLKSINELVALTKGINAICPEAKCILDIGGQDTKIICQKNGRIESFFLNEKCAAGSGMFLINTLHLLNLNLNEINLMGHKEADIKLSTMCAVFAQSEIVELIADNVCAPQIVDAVIWQIITQARSLLRKVSSETIYLTGGFTKINGIAQYMELALNKKVIALDNGEYLASFGCALK